MALVDEALPFSPWRHPCGTLTTQLLETHLGTVSQGASELPSYL